MRFKDAINKYVEYKSLEKQEKTLNGYKLDLMQLCLFLRNPIITSVMIDHVIEYLNLMKELGWGQNTILIKGVVFTQFFKFWKQKDYPVLNYELIPHVKREYTEARVADDVGINKVLEVCDKYPDDPYFIRMKAMILLTMDTGARNGEICSLNIDINTTNGEKFDTFTQYSTIIKTEKSRGKNPFRRVFWYDKTNQALKRWLEVRQSESKALFVGLGGQGARMVGERMTVQATALAMRKISKIAGIKTLNMHSLRHKFGNDLATPTEDAEGANASTISDLMGHASLASSFRYSHINQKQQSTAHVRLKRKRLA